MSTTISNDNSEDFEPDDFCYESGYDKVIVTARGFVCDECDDSDGPEGPIGYNEPAALSPNKMKLLCKKHFLMFASREGFEDLTWDGAKDLSEPWWNAR